MSLSCRNSFYPLNGKTGKYIFYFVKKCGKIWCKRLCRSLYVEKVKNLTDGIAAVAVLPMMLEVQTGLIAFEYGQKLLSLQGLVM